MVTEAVVGGDEVGAVGAVTGPTGDTAVVLL